MNDRTCSNEECLKPQHARGLCNTHHRKALRNNSLPQTEMTDTERFWAKVQVGGPDECWPWVSGAEKHNGYPRFNINGASVKAHRWAYTLANGPLPVSVAIDHRCRNRVCQNPLHLRPVSAKENAENLARTSRGVSGLRGVHFSKSRNAYRVRVVHNGVNYHGGDFRNLDDADRAATTLRLRLYTHNEEDRAM